MRPHNAIIIPCGENEGDVPAAKLIRQWKHHPPLHVNVQHRARDVGELVQSLKGFLYVCDGADDVSTHGVQHIDKIGHDQQVILNHQNVTATKAVVSYHEKPPK